MEVFGLGMTIGRNTISKGAYDRLTNAFYHSALKLKNDRPERKEAASDLNPISSAQN